MRVLLHAKFPHEQFNAAVRDGSAGKKINRILEESRPEAAYFTEYGGRRGAVLIINVEEASQIPRFAEPWFLTFNADVEFHLAMKPDELGKAGLDSLGKKWA
ncbi:MAG TPA: panthothenate synthetase [Candidatus Polarisedimenticolia bacterium]|nr:panthothenate synthetase [Candidatus Polarisedimenticolia bacterium]